MIPLKLQLKNFLSYGPQLQTIDFTPHHLICLNGKNGHGKSALLDAMTWALWGQARKTSATAKPDAQLLRLGQTHMLVLFEFSFNEQLYRIRREYAEQNGKPHAALDFVLIDAQTHRALPLTDKTIKATQEKIESLIGLDFDSFVNSAFLRQGQSNEFSKKSPKERKEILASILNLENYERVRSLTLSRARQAEQKIKVQQELLKNLEHRCHNHTHLIEQQEKLSTDLTQIEKELKASAQKKEWYESNEKKLDAIKRQIDVAGTTHKKYQDEAYEHRNQLLLTLKKWRATHRSLRQASNTYDEQEYNHLHEKATLFQEKYAELMSLKDEHLYASEQKETVIKSCVQQLSAERKVQQQKLEVVIKEIAQCTLALSSTQNEKKQICGQIAQIEHEAVKQEERIAALNATLEEKRKLVANFDKRKNYYHQWAALHKTLSQKQSHAHDQKTILANSTNPSCPVCEQNVSLARKRFLLSQANKDEEILARKITRLARTLTLLKNLLMQQHEELKIVERLEKEHTHLAHQLEQLKNNLSKLKANLPQLDEKLKDLPILIERHEKEYQQQRTLCSAIEQQIADPATHHPEIAALQNRVMELRKKIDTFAYDAIEHEKTKNSITRLEAHRNHQALQAVAQAEQSHLFEKIITTINELRALKKNSTLIATHINEWEQQKNDLQNFLAEYPAFKESAQKLNTIKEELLELRGRLTTEINQVEKAAQDSKRLMLEIAELEKVYDEYQIIAHAFGKEGIQALLIEDALPEIEYEANILLAQLTHNQAHIIIDSLRDLKKGGAKETLDIKISDPLGIRPYEMFSGGEAFRIDFALRIAISKLLARRAGTSLQTLIIDEGFGSLDEDGLAQIAEALYKIQDHFAKVIIVSHLPTMKEQFPTHFIVEKGAQGSTVSILNNG